MSTAAPIAFGTRRRAASRKPRPRSSHHPWLPPVTPAEQFLSAIPKGTGKDQTEAWEIFKRRLRHKRAQEVRKFTSDATGHNMSLLIAFQRRVRAWIANNALFLGYYEDHRRALHAELHGPLLPPVEAALARRRQSLEQAAAEAEQSLQEHVDAPRYECEVRLKLAECQGELLALQGFGADSARVTSTARRDGRRINPRGVWTRYPWPRRRYPSASCSPAAGIHRSSGQRCAGG